MTMAASAILIFIFTSFISSIPIIPVAKVQQSNFLYQICSDKQGNYTANGTYQTNLHTLLSSLTSNDNINTGFYASSYGKIPDIVYATGLCRGDVKPDDCRSCLNDSRHLLTQLCPNQKEAIIWYRKCTLRYSNRQIFGIMERFPAFCMTNKRNISSDRSRGRTFNPELRALLENLRMHAASGDSSRKFAVGITNGTNHLPNIHALVQCIPDLLDADCSDCIVRGVKILERYCNGSIWAYVGLSSCNVAYDLKLFYNSTTDMLIQLPPPPPPQPQMPLPSSPGKRNNTSRYVTIISLSSVVSFMVLLLCVSLSLRMRKAKGKMETNSSCQAEEGSYNNAEFSKFDFSVITDATDNFLDANKLGQGGFGAVYRGRLSNGKEIAVKRLKKDSGTPEFQNEVQLIAKLKHRNLVNLLGFCLEKHERILVYEFVPNSSLDRFLFDPIKREHLDWNTRYKIIIGITRGLLYLHEESCLKIIHRDLKAGNILLDAEMNPKIADFGTARLFALDQSEEITEKIVGTYGYMAPEYARHGSFSVKSDVFSFGVLVLEIVCGQKVNNFCDGEKPQSLLSYAWENWKKGKAMNLVDPKMRTASRHEILRCIHIGLLCVQEKRADRPTMRSVVLMLSSYSLALRSPSQPAYFVKLEREASSADPSRYENTSAPISENHVPVTELFPR